MKKYLIALSLVGLVTTSCYEKLNIAPPNAITNEQVQKLLENANEDDVVIIMGALANALPSTFRGGGYTAFGSDQYVNNFAGQLCSKDFTGNDVVVDKNAPTGDLASFYSGLLVREYTSGFNYPYWKRGYTMNGAANKVTDMLTDELLAKNLSKKLREYKGRALLTRAFGYNYLIENYQDAYLQGGKDKDGVPIYTKFSNAQPLVKRSSVSAVYDSIIKWTNTAIQLYTDAGVGYTTGEDAKWADIDMGVAKYILARASLLKGDYATVISAANDILAAYPTLIPEDAYVGKNVRPADDPNRDVVPEFRAENLAFTSLAKNPEAILGWYALGSNAAYGAQVNFFNFNGEMRIDNRLYEQIDPKDFRIDNFLDATEYGGWIAPAVYKSWKEDPSKVTPVVLGSYLNFKWANTVGLNGTYGADVSDQWQMGKTDACLMRTSEVLLMKAEAQAMSGGDWKSTLNTLLAARTRSGEAPLTVDTYKGMAGKSAMEVIQLQWRIEMWGENGWEWYNNRRWNLPVNRAGSLNHHNPNMTYSVANMTLQIPEQEINTNPLSTQNP